MKTKIWQDPWDEKVTFKTIDTTCPFCKRPVKFAVPDVDVFIEADRDFYKQKVDWLQRRVEQLEKILNRILDMPVKDDDAGSNN